MRVSLLVWASALALLAAGCGAASRDASRDATAPAGEGPSAGADTQEAPSPATEPAATAPGEEPELLPEAKLLPEEDPGFLAFGWSTDFSRHTVPLSEFQSGGPGKDGIPAINAPRFVTTTEANEWLERGEPVIELVVGDDARAYPLQILIWHEIVNDEVGGVPVAVTFCPLCYTTIVFERRVDGRVLDFGVSGNLRNSDLVMYDRQTESWWQQFGGESVVGELAGKTLRPIPARIVAWEEFRERHPDGKVLSRETGHSRPYGANPYTGYDTVDQPPFFPAANLDDDRLSPKERVVFVEIGGEALVVPFPALERAKRLEVEVGGQRLEVVWKPGARTALGDQEIPAARVVGSADVRSADTGEPVPFDTPFWFAVAAFRADVRIVQG